MLQLSRSFQRRPSRQHESARHEPADDGGPASAFHGALEQHRGADAFRAAVRAGLPDQGVARRPDAPSGGTLFPQPPLVPGAAGGAARRVADQPHDELACIAAVLPVADVGQPALRVGDHHCRTAQRGRRAAAPAAALWRLFLFVLHADCVAPQRFRAAATGKVMSARVESGSGRGGARPIYLALFGLYTRYMLVAYLRHTFMVVAALMTIALTIDLWPQVSLISGNPMHVIWSLARLTLLRLSDLLPPFVPFATFLGVAWSE